MLNKLSFALILFILFTSKAIAQNELELLEAAFSGDDKKVFYLLKGGVNPNVFSEEGVTPLMYAADKGYLYIAELLIKYGAEPNLIPNNQLTALASATQNNRVEIIKLLLENYANPNICDENGNTPLIWAALYGYPLAAGYLCIYGADISYQNIFGTNAAMIAAWFNDVEMLDVFYNYYADFDVSDYSGFTPLMVAAQQGNNEACEFLIRHESNVNRVNDDGLNAFELAAVNGKFETVKLLSENFSEKNREIKEGLTLYDYLVYKEFKTIAEFILAENKGIIKKSTSEGIFKNKKVNFASKNIDDEF